MHDSPRSGSFLGRLLRLVFSSRGVATLLALALIAIAVLAAPHARGLADLYRRNQWRKDMERRAFFDGPEPRLAAYVSSLGPAPSNEVFDQVRGIIAANCVIEFNESLVHEPDLILERIAACVLDGVGPEKRPRVMCYNRALAMAVLLHHLGYESRMVHGLRVDDQGAFSGSHSFLEVLNPETGAWEYQDPLYDMAFMRVSDGERAQTLDLMLLEPGELEPLSSEGRGWDLAQLSPEDVRRQTAIIVYDNRMSGEKSVCLVNGRRAGGRGVILRSADELDPSVRDYVRSVWFDAVYVME